MEFVPDGVLQGKLLGNFGNHSPEWFEARKGRIGGSSVGTVLGLNPYRSAMTEYYTMTGEYQPENKPSMSMRLGTKLEDDILEIFCEEHPELEIYQVGTYTSETHDWVVVNPDAVYRDKDGNWGLIEVKFSRDYFNDIPASYEAQMLYYMRHLGLKSGYLVALCNSAYVEKPLEFDQFKSDAHWDAVKRFYDNVQKGIRPEFDSSVSTYDTIRSIKQEIDPNDRVELGDLAVHLSNAYSDYKAAELHYRELQSRTLDALGEAKYGVYDDEIICQRQARAGYAPTLQMKKAK